MGRRLFFQIYPAFLLLIALTILPTAWFATRIFRDFYIANIRTEVSQRATMLKPQILAHLSEPGFLEFCRKTAEDSGTRLTVIAPDGKVLCDSDGDYSVMPSHEERPELKQALAERRLVSSQRYSATLMKEMIYVADPLVDAKGDVVGAFRLSLPLAVVDTNIGALKIKLFFFAVFLALLSMGFGLLISIAVFFFPGPLMSIFIDPGEQELIAIGSEYLRIEGAFYILIGYLFLFYGIFRALKAPAVSLVLTIISLGLRVLLAALLSATALGVTGIWLSVPIGWAAADAAGVLFLAALRRKRGGLC